MTNDSAERIRQKPAAILFDVDGTLLDLLQQPSDETFRMLEGLLQRDTPIAIVTGGSFKRIHADILKPLEAHIRPDNCYVFVDQGAECYMFNGTEWKIAYKHAFSDEERVTIKDVITSSVTESASPDGFAQSDISIRDSKAVFTGIPNNTPEVEKELWRGDGSKMANLKKAVEARLPGFDVHVDGPKITALVVTRKGIDKAYAVRWLAEHLGVGAEKMLFIGDGFAEDGNDRAALPSGVKALRTGGPEYTRRIIKKLMES